MFDKEKILTKINFIKQCINKLNELREIEKTEFLNQFRNIDSAKYNLVVAIEAILEVLLVGIYLYRQSRKLLIYPIRLLHLLA